MQIPRKPLPGEEPLEGPILQSSFAKDVSTSAPPVRGISFATFIDKHFPPYKRNLGLSRRKSFIVLVAIVIAIAALIIGLAVGLTLRAR